MDAQNNITAADFTTIRANLKTYLENQSQFSDYDFTGSALSVLLDILAYNTSMNAAHANLVFSESFLDSAITRGAVVSRAKELGYTPRSKSASSATVTISFTVAGNPAQYTIPKNTKFTASNDGVAYTFVTAEDVLVNNVGNIFTTSLTLYQGKFNSFQYTVDLTDASQRFIIPSKDADTQFLTVLYKENSAVTSWTEFSNDNNLIRSDYSLLSASLIYFLKEAYDEYFEVYFGDGTIGQAVANGNIIKLEYLITDGKLANNAKTFALASTLANVSNISVTTIDTATGGDDKESIDSIKFLAPMYNATKYRAVTEDDYVAILKSQYSNIEDVSVWGGENNVPPYYGKVFIAVKPKVGDFLSSTAKSTIQNEIIKNYNVVTIRPEIVDPDYTKVSVNAVVLYDGKLYNPTSGINLNTLVETAIEEFFDSSANQFTKTLYFSKLVNAIDSASYLILSSIVNLSLEKQLEIYSGISGTYTYNFNNAIASGSVLSNEFTISGVNWKIKDIPNTSIPPTAGALAIFRVDGQNNTIYLSTNTGTVDYTTGQVVINNLKIDSIVDEPILGLLKIQVSPGAVANTTNPEVVYLDNNIYCNEREQIIALADNGITITLLPDNTI